MKMIKAGEFVLYTDDKTAKEIEDDVISRLKNALENEGLLEKIIEEFNNERIRKGI